MKAGWCAGWLLSSMHKYSSNVAGFRDGGETYNADHMSKVSVFTRDKKEWEPSVTPKLMEKRLFYK